MSEKQNKNSNAIEVDGVTVEDAIKKAQEILGKGKEELIIKVVSEEKKGLFGMEGAKPAKIMVTVKTKENS